MSVPIMVVVNAGVRHEGDGEGEGEGERKRETAGMRACVQACQSPSGRPAGGVRTNVLCTVCRVMRVVPSALPRCTD